ncbi:MAG: glutamate--tRNA ligase, partial [Mariprofundaceae bacterium]
RTALLNWLYAHKHGGRFLLRFEDTDRARSEQQFIHAIEEDLSWLGLSWDGDALFQSGHADKHLQALENLASKGLAYRCFCSESQLALDRKLATSRGLPPRYNGRCRGLSAEESETRAATEPFVWRLAIHAEAGEVVVADALRDDVHFSLADLDDPVVVRSDGSFTFLLPNALDDALDGITHAMRGDDHLTNSAYQVWLLERLGYQPPVYLHHGLLLGPDGAKLSKRSGSHSVAELRQAGLLPGALVQAMTRLGHPNLPDDALDIADLAAAFEAEHVSTSAVRWSDDEMWRWHTRLLHMMPVDQLLGLVQADMPKADRGFVQLIQPNLERVENATSFCRLLDAKAPLGLEEMAIASEAGAEFYAEAEKQWQAVGVNGSADDVAAGWKAWSTAIKAETGRSGRNLFMPLRVALTGAAHGPDMSSVLAYLGKGGVDERLKDIQRQVSV